MNTRKILDGIGLNVFRALTVLAGLLIVLMALGLVLKSVPLLSMKPLNVLLFSSAWNPLRNEFGFLPFIAGTAWVVGAAVAIAVPVSILTSIYLSEYAGRRVKALMRPLLDLLAGIPSVVYGVWGVLAVVPLVKNHVAPLFSTFSSGYTVLSAGLVLAIMIFPVIINVCVEVLGMVPVEVREASMSLGATRWQTVKHVVLRRAMPGIVAANILGISRAFGETMAVLMLAGNVARMPSSLLDPAYPLPALIANNYGEMLSIPLYDSALFFAALLLFAVVLFFNI
ncbi:MAG: phosphate ABC transporter permease subunit PstC, partial [Lentisphaerae bacterium]|nr:phosphate ABC transporter permease subunit PstC [Lentisphaerota bacterium]